MDKILYWINQLLIKITCCIFHCVLSLVYWKKGKIVPPVRNTLLLKSATKLAEEIREGKIKSEDVVKAYIVRIEEVDPYINATVERCFYRALDEAKAADDLVVSGKYTNHDLASNKPLLGVPITVKIILTVKGMRCTGGSVLFENLVASEDAAVVYLMKQAGAIILTTTNAPEFAMAFETNNRIHGKTCNPYDTNRTSGGSSGGESALIAAGGSVLGLGNDILGSLRVPAHFTGIFAHKPTIDLVSNSGSFPGPAGAKPFLYSGPMCRYAEDLVTSMKVLASPIEYPIKFGEPVNFSKVKICYLIEMHYPFVVNVDKDIKLALRNAVSFFETTYNSRTEEVTLSSLHDANRCVVHNFLAEVKDVQGTMTAGKGGHFNIKKEFLKLFIGKTPLSYSPIMFLNLFKSPLWYRGRGWIPHYQKMREEMTEEFDKLLDEDTVLLLPTLPVSAPYHAGIIPYFLSTCYTSIFNIMGLPSTQCPLGFNRQGLPIGIQIVSKKNNDALTIACAIDLEKAFGGWRSPGS